MLRPQRLVPLLLLLAWAPLSWSAAKSHVVALGPWSRVKYQTGPDETSATELRVRPLTVDGRTREFTTGEPHDVTDRLFVVRRAYRINDALPDEHAGPRWRWQRGGWLLVDRTSGHVASVPLASFDPVFSDVVWYRDYAAYCGLSEAGDKRYAVVVELGRRKPLLHKVLLAERTGDEPAPPCTAPAWERQPARVSFQAAGKDPVSYSIRGRTVEPDTGADEDDED